MLGTTGLDTGGGEQARGILQSQNNGSDEATDTAGSKGRYFDCLIPCRPRIEARPGTLYTGPAYGHAASPNPLRGDALYSSIAVKANYLA